MTWGGEPACEVESGEEFIWGGLDRVREEGRGGWEREIAGFVLPVAAREDADGASVRDGGGDETARGGGFCGGEGSFGVGEGFAERSERG